MSVDMFRDKFLARLRALPAFTPATSSGSRDQIPAWRAVFTSLLLYKHAENYELFTLQLFFDTLKRALLRNANSERFIPLFEEGTKAAIEFADRVRNCYESGMQETYLYSCLVEIIEDKMKCGLILYDPRADWKLKADAIVIMGSKVAKLDVYRGTEARRSGVVEKRETNERIAKRNTLESSHFGNGALDAMHAFQMPLNSDTIEAVNGFRLFKLDAVNALLTSIFEFGEVPAGKRILYTSHS